MNISEANFYNSMNKISNVSDCSYRLFLDKSQSVDFKRESIIVKIGHSAPFVYFVLEGFTRSFIFRDKKDCTVWFSKPGEPMSLIMGKLSAEQSRVNVQALTNCKLLKIARADLEDLFCSNLELCNWGRIMADTFISKAEVIFTRDLVSNATERYENLLKESPELIQQVPLKHLASYLLVTPESLSRIRKELVKPEK